MQHHSHEAAFTQALSDTENLGAMPDADAEGTAGSPGCGDSVKMWIKFKQENGRKVIDRASFETFGCQTALAVAAMAARLVRGRTAEEALTLRGEEIAAPLGPLPPMKIHCAQLVEDALRKALNAATSPAPQTPATPPPTAGPIGPVLAEALTGPSSASAKKIVFLTTPSPSTAPNQLSPTSQTPH